MLRSTLISAAALAFAAPALAGTFVFETAAPVADRHVIAYSTVWTCEDTTCVGELDRKTVSLRICKKIAKEVGEVAALRNDKSELDAADLETCKASAKS
jgi:hypothetical protein